MASRLPPLEIACNKCGERQMMRNGYAKDRHSGPAYPQARCRSCGHTQLIAEEDRDLGPPVQFKPKTRAQIAKDSRDRETPAKRAERLRKDRERKRLNRQKRALKKKQENAE